ncbi:hypothetical protein [Parachlamydia acanthamoebae]|uniref:hypothetical protein n=1 Tax=Parachlamydia acanthamoebae TaxID=83552 RepID=UPI000750AF82|nr:hypothetical protein [Parachlamydia acanthamoebae]
MGFLAEYEGLQLIHFWELSRKASMPHMRIAQQLIHAAKKQMELYPNLKFATLNVDAHNSHAKGIYDGENFTASDQKKADEKIFMKNKLTSDSKVDLKPEASKIIVKKFVLKSIPL